MLFSMAYQMFSMTDTASATGQPPSVTHLDSPKDKSVMYESPMNALFAALKIIILSLL